VSGGGFDIDDFRDSDWGSRTECDSYTREPFDLSGEPSPGSVGSQGGAEVKRKLAQLREVESNSDRLFSRGHEQQEVHHPRPGDPSELPTNRERAEYQGRDRTHLLRPSEIHTLTEVGKFRLVAIEDLAKHAYAGDRLRID